MIISKEADIIASKLKTCITDVVIQKRLSMSLSRKDFAKYLGVSRYKLNKWESGHYNFTTEEVGLIIVKCNLKTIVGNRCYDFSKRSE